MAANRIELLATWYLRFNGFFTTPDFTIHPDWKGKDGGTDADVLAVRFRHSTEYQARFMFERDPHLGPHADVEFLIGEVKSSVCDLNEPWRNPAKGNIDYALRWMGFEAGQDKLEAIARTLYQTGHWDSGDGSMAVRFVVFGETPNESLKKAMPGIDFILHPQVITYLRRRFRKSCLQITRMHWDPIIVEFAALCENDNVTESQLLAWAKGGFIDARAP